jgi:hypothetical protein
MDFFFIYLFICFIHFPIHFSRKPRTMSSSLSSASSSAAAIAQLQRHFGGQVDADVLQAILEMHNNDVRQAQAFLEADAGGGAAVSFHELQAAAANGQLPRDYPPQGARTVAEWQQWQRRQQQQQPHANSGNQFELIRDLFEQEASVETLVAVEQLSFVAVVVVSVLNGVEFSRPMRGKLLAAAWARHDFALADFLLTSGGFGLVEVLRAAKLLDGRRALRALEARLARATAPARRSHWRERIGELAADAPFGSLSGALKRRIRGWVRARVSAAALTLESLGMPVAAWRELADLVHLAPADFALDWFARYVHTGALPADSVAAQFAALLAASPPSSSSSSLERLLQLQIPFVAIRANAAALGLDGGGGGALPLALRAHVASYEDAATLIWHYEALACAETNASILRQLAGGAALPFALGKLLERAIALPAALRPALLALADAKLQSLSLPLAPPVLVLGDASNSMDVAIRVSTILAGVCCNLCDATLRFFNERAVVPASMPHSAAAIVELASRTRAAGLTACAAGLHEFYASRTYFKTLILVSDEIENEPFDGEWWFPTLFAKYRAEVSPDVQLALVSFRESQQLGRIHSALLRQNIDPIALSLSAERPDSSRVDSLLAKLAQFSPGWSALLERTVLAVKNQINSGRAAGRETSVVDLIRSQLTRPPVAAAAAAAVAVATPIDPIDECVVCEERAVEMAFAPCGHFVCCAQCAATLIECPMCRNSIRDKVKIYKK